MKFAYGKERPAKSKDKRKTVCARLNFATMLAVKNVRIQLTFSSEWPLEHNDPASARIVLSECAIDAGSMLNGICQDFYIPYCPSHEQVGSFGPAFECGILALAARSLELTATQRHSNLRDPAYLRLLLGMLQNVGVGFALALLMWTGVTRLSLVVVVFTCAVTSLIVFFFGKWWNNKPGV